MRESFLIYICSSIFSTVDAIYTRPNNIILGMGIYFGEIVAC